MKVQVTVDTAKLRRLVVNAYQLHGEAIRWGIPAPAPMHTGRPGAKPSERPVTTAFTLARVEFGSGGRVRETQERPVKARPGFLGRARRGARALLGKLLRGFRGRPTPRPTRQVVPQDPGRERPVIRWVAAARRADMVDGFKAAAKRALAGHDPRPDLQALGDRLATLTMVRLRDVGGVDTGQTLRAIRYEIGRRYG